MNILSAIAIAVKVEHLVMHAELTVEHVVMDSVEHSTLSPESRVKRDCFKLPPIFRVLKTGRY